MWDTIIQRNAEKNRPENALSQRDMTSYDDERPATKGDLSRLREELRGEIRASADQLREEMSGLRDELIDKMRDIETNLLRAFQDWSAPVAIQLRSIPHIEQRLGLLEERVTAIEHRQGPSIT